MGNFSHHTSKRKRKEVFFLFHSSKNQFSWKENLQNIFRHKTQKRKRKLFCNILIEGNYKKFHTNWDGIRWREGRKISTDVIYSYNQTLLQLYFISFPFNKLCDVPLMLFISFTLIIFFFFLFFSCCIILACSPSIPFHHPDVYSTLKPTFNIIFFLLAFSSLRKAKNTFFLFSLLTKRYSWLSTLNNFFLSLPSFLFLFIK